MNLPTPFFEFQLTIFFCFQDKILLVRLKSKYIPYTIHTIHNTYHTQYIRYTIHTIHNTYHTQYIPYTHLHQYVHIFTQTIYLICDKTQIYIALQISRLSLTKLLSTILHTTNTKTYYPNLLRISIECTLLYNGPLRHNHF